MAKTTTDGRRVFLKNLLAGAASAGALERARAHPMATAEWQAIIAKIDA